MRRKNREGLMAVRKKIRELRITHEDVSREIRVPSLVTIGDYSNRLGVSSMTLIMDLAANLS